MSIEDRHERLRSRAEALLRERREQAAPVGRALEAILHDLSVHQVELELQNEELRDAQVATAAARDEFARLYHEAPVGYLSLDANGMIRNANQTFARMCQRDRGDLLDRPFADLLAGPDGEVFRGRYRAFFQAPDQKILSGCLERPDGSGLFVRLTARREGDGKRLLAVIHDVSEIQRISDELSAEQALRAATLQSIVDAVIAVDVNLRITLMNAAAERLLETTAGAARGQPLAELLPVANVAGEVLARGEVVATEAPATWKQLGRTVLLVQTGAPIRDAVGVQGVVLVLRDVTEYQALQERLGRVDKLDSLGLMAGGIAHGFNNALTKITTNLGLVRVGLGDVGLEEVAAALADAEQAAVAARELTKRLLTFARGGTPVRSVIELGPLVRDSASYTLSPRNTRYELRVEEPLWPVFADGGQVAQALHHILVNAADVSADTVVRIAAENVVLGIETRVPLAAGRYVRVDVIDRGPGIAAAIQQRIFDPFFTTRPDRTGLGLTAAHSIVRSHDGYLEAHSEEGYGARFSVYLPASAATWQPVQERIAQRPWRILVLDDEPMIATAARRILARRGHSVTTVSHGEAAIAAVEEARARGEPFDLLILDLTIPGRMGGREALARIKAVDPEARAIASSGYTDDPVMSDHRAHGFAACLPKPYTLDELHSLIASLQAPS